LRLAAPVVLCATLASLAPPAAAQRRALETGDLRLIYLDPLQSYVAPHVARCFENALGFHRKLWDYDPWDDKMTVLLLDLSDSGNAAAGAVPRDVLLLEMSPLSLAYETLSPNERMNWLVNHELMHVVAMDQAARGDRVFRRLFSGKVIPISDHPESIVYFYLTNPRAAAPRWYQEGIAVFVETWMAGGLGRAQGAWDEMVFRAMVRDGSRIYDPLGLSSEGTQVDFQVGVNSYLYGTRFMTYLAHEYSPEALVRWVARKDGTRRYFASQFREVFGKPLEDAWREWSAFERSFQERNLAEIRRYPTTPLRDVSGRALGSVSRAHYDDRTNRVYAAVNYPGTVGHVAAISLEDGRSERLADIKQPALFTVTSLAWDAQERTLFYTADNYARRDLVALDPDTRKRRTLIKDARVGDLAFNTADRSLWGVRHFNGIASLVRIPEPWREWQLVRSWPYGEVLYDLDVSPDGRLLSASTGDVSGRHRLRVFEIQALLAGGAEPPEELLGFDFGTALPLNFVFSRDGRFLYGSSYYTGVSNVYRYDVQARELQAVSNCETGCFRPLPIRGDELVVFRYSGAGFVAARLEARPIEDIAPIQFLGERTVERHPVLKDWKLGSPAEVPLESLVTSRRPYSSLGSVKLESLYPVVQGYKDSTAFGVRANLSDPAGLNRFGLTASFSPSAELDRDERLHVAAEFRRYDWRASVRYNAADFYDLFGPTKRSRKGWAVGLEHVKTLIWDEPRSLELGFDGTYYSGLEQLPEYQNVAASFDRFFTLGARLGYNDVRSSLGHVDDEKGVRWELLATADIVEGDAFPKLVGNLDLGRQLPIGHSSLWLRSSAGWSPGPRDEALANFFFGGFGNNYVDYRPEKRYHEFYSFPGTELNEIGGTNHLKSALEWNLPPLRFRGVGREGFYAPWLRASLFAGGLGTNVDRAARRRVLWNAGAQLDLRLMALSRLELTLSAGYARAFEHGFRPRDEGMISLKVLK
jgi:hypothetical protein